MRIAPLLALLLASCAPVSDPATPRAVMTWDDFNALPAAPAPDAVERYGEEPYQVVDVWVPKGPGPHPTVLMIHGGCWQTSIADRTIMHRAAADLRGRGIGVWNIDYRGVDRVKPREMLIDVMWASDLLRRRGRQHSLDHTNVVSVGHSAGGHLALYLSALVAEQKGGLRITHQPPSSGPPKLPDVKKVISLGGLPDVEQAATPPGSGCGVEIAQRLLAGVPAERISVSRLLPLGVPQTLVNGDSDRIIPTHYAADYAAKARAAGDEVTVHVVPGQGHVELISPGTPAWEKTVEVIERALGR